MKKIFYFTIATALITGLTGCGSLESRSDGTQSGLYPGVKADLDGASESSASSILDLPFSFALDTVLLPFDLLKGKDDSPAPQP